MKTITFQVQFLVGTVKRFFDIDQQSKNWLSLTVKDKQKTGIGIFRCTFKLNENIV